MKRSRIFVLVAFLLSLTFSFPTLFAGNGAGSGVDFSSGPLVPGGGCTCRDSAEFFFGPFEDEAGPFSVGNFFTPDGACRCRNQALHLGTSFWDGYDGLEHSYGSQRSAPDTRDIELDYIHKFNIASDSNQSSD